MTEFTLAQLDDIRETCRAMVRRRAAASAAASVVPLPGVDAAADVAMLVQLLPSLSREFGLTPAQIEALDERGKTAAYSMIKGMTDSFVGRAITRKLVMGALTQVGARVGAKQVVKFAPIVGQAAAAGLSFTIMRWLGNKHIDECYAVARKVAEARLFGPDAVIIEGVQAKRAS